MIRVDVRAAGCSHADLTAKGAWMEELLERLSTLKEKLETIRGHL
jgi:hypothetical protein